MQYDGWLETMIQARFPKHELTFRNLGFSGDEIATRLRSKNFGTPDEWLSGTGDADRRLRGEPLREHQHEGRRRVRVLRLQRVVCRRGRPRGVQEAALADWITHTLAQQYNGKTAPRVVRLLADRARGSGQPGSAGRQGEQQAAGAVHQGHGRGRARRKASRSSISYTPSLKLYADQQPPLTINGVHLNTEGNRRIAEVIDRALFGARADTPGGVPARRCGRRSRTRTSTGFTAIASPTATRPTATARS